MLGLTFKKDVKDIRNSKSAELYYKFYNKLIIVYELLFSEAQVGPLQARSHDIEAIK